MCVCVFVCVRFDIESGGSIDWLISWLVKAINIDNDNVIMGGVNLFRS